MSHTPRHGIVLSLRHGAPQRLPAKQRLGTDRIARGTTVRYTCPGCQRATAISFDTFDALMCASLQNALPGASHDDPVAAAFDRVRPMRPGERGLDGVCAGCGARFRVLARGGEIDRDGAIDYTLDEVLEAIARPASASG